MRTTPAPRHTVDVRPPSLRREGIAVARVAWLVAALAYVAILLRRTDGAGTVAGAGLAHQTRFRDLESADQRVILALQEALTEAENVRATNLVWSSTTALAARGVPPFAPDPIARDPFAWTFRREKNVVTYAGAPEPGSGSKRPAFLLSIVELGEDESEAEPRPAVPRRALPDGTELEISFWIHPEPVDLGPMITSPGDRGWTEVIFESSARTP